jgi:DNA polymerase-3 subunit gamma/tau
VTDSSSVMQRVSQNWLRVRAVVKKKHPATEALLNSCRPLAIKDGVLILSFATEIVKSKMENLENIEITRQAIASVAGIELMIRCVVGNKGTANSTDLDVDRDGMVGTALNLGGKIVHKE